MPSPEEIMKEREEMKQAAIEGGRLINSVDKKEGEEVIAKYSLMIGLGLLPVTQRLSMSVIDAHYLKATANTMFLTGYVVGKEKQKETDRLEVLMQKEVR